MTQGLRIVPVPCECPTCGEAYQSRGVRTAKECPTCTKKRNVSKMMKWKKDNPSRYKEHMRRGHLRMYGLEEEDYNRLCEHQMQKCAICGEIPDKLVVDHDHRTGEVRGLLCSLCNAALGMFKDSPTSIMRAAEYLERRHQKWDANEP